jgi:hypothetical protein
MVILCYFFAVIYIHRFYVEFPFISSLLEFMTESGKIKSIKSLKHKQSLANKLQLKVIKPKIYVLRPVNFPHFGPFLQKLQQLQECNFRHQEEKLKQTSHHKPGSSHVGFVVDEAALGQVFSEYFGFPCQSSYHQLHHNHHHL